MEPVGMPTALMGGSAGHLLGHQGDVHMHHDILDVG